MKIDNIESSVIRRIGYDAAGSYLLNHGTVYIEFKKNNVIWAYKNVSYCVYNELRSAHSVGRYYSENIKGKYDSEKIEDSYRFECKNKEPIKNKKKERTVNDLVRIARETFVKHIEDIEVNSVISEIDGESYPALSAIEKQFLYSAIDIVKKEFLNKIQNS